MIQLCQVPTVEEREDGEDLEPYNIPDGKCDGF